MKKNRKLKFSVLMSIYFKENPEHLDACLNSVLINQTLLPNEIVMVKDGRLTKELEEVLSKYDKNFPNVFKFLPLDDNVGLGMALQKGLSECSNEIVIRMDTDDICVPSRFEKQIDYMEKNQNVSVIGGYIEEFSTSIDENLRMKKMPISYDDVVKYAKFRNPLNHMTVCFKKSDILAVDGYKPLHFLEDYYLWIRVLMSGKIIENIPETLVYARIGNGFNERRGSKKQIKGWKNLQKIMYKNHFINWFEKERNIICIYLFTFISSNMRKKIYNCFLRK